MVLTAIFSFLLKAFAIILLSAALLMSSAQTVFKHKEVRHWQDQAHTLYQQILVRSAQSAAQLREAEEKKEQEIARLKQDLCTQPVEDWIVSIENESWYQPEDDPSYLWVDGFRVEVGTGVGEAEFARVYDRALKRGMYNGVNLEEGGLFLLKRDRWLVRGYGPTTAAEKALAEMSPEESRIPLSILCPD